MRILESNNVCDYCRIGKGSPECVGPNRGIKEFDRDDSYLPCCYNLGDEGYPDRFQGREVISVSELDQYQKGTLVAYNPITKVVDYKQDLFKA